MKILFYVLNKIVYDICKNYVIHEDLDMTRVKDKVVNVYFNTFILMWLD